MFSNAPLTTPQDLAWFLASYARDARARVEAVADLPALAAVRDALEGALGMKFSGERGEHFFRSTLVQTIFYGVFSAWVLWHRQRPGRTDAFNWHEAQWSLHVPFIRALYDEIATPSKLGDLGLVEVLDWTAGVLNRVKRGAFFEKFQDEHAVQYFYEPFLEAFDPQLRKELGVWYTPREVVRYQVARVDAVLREELDVPDGLADPNVVVLDPCCGTGAYLVETLARIVETLKAKGGDALIASDLKEAAMTRVFGFEILPAPFVVSHLQLGLLLHRLGVPLSAKSKERVGVYLTNSLTGWEPPKEPKQLLFSELAAERDAADQIKRGQRILVVLGNPPYNGFAGVAMAEERALSEAYRTNKQAPAPQGQGLNDLYVRFFRMAERRIVEMNKPGGGVVCFISNYSWLDGLSFTGMRERYLEAFDAIWIDCLNGDKYKTGKLTPEGEPDPSVFSTEHNREGIQVGTAVALLLRKQDHKPAKRVSFRHFWGKAKRAELAAAARKDKQTGYTKAQPTLAMGLSFQPAEADGRYITWPLLIEVLPCSSAPFMHTVAMLHSPAYSRENAGGLRQDWPRVPLPNDGKSLEASAALGRQMAALLDTETEVRGVTTGRLEALFRTVGMVAKVGGGGLNSQAGDLAATAGWGHVGKGGVTMPAKGRIEHRAYDMAEREAIAEAAAARGLSVEQLLSLLGPTTCDVFLNPTAYWKNIPLNVWEYFLGGYQVIKKWLSYREQELLGRPLKADEAREVTNMARRMTAIILLQPALDENYRQVKAHTYSWPPNAEATAAK
jgi:hypothetical protein